MFVIIIIAYLLPIFFYLLAHEIPNRKWLTIYSFFWLTVTGFAIYDFMVATSSTNKDNDLSLGWFVIAGFIYPSCYTATIGIVSRATVLYLKYKGKNVNNSIVHLVGFGAICILPTLPILIEVFSYFIRLNFK